MRIIIRANISSAWLCSADVAGCVVVVLSDEDGPAEVVEVPHAPSVTAAATRAAVIISVFFTLQPDSAGMPLVVVL